MKKLYIKRDRTKCILVKFFFTRDLQKNGDINVHQVCLCENLANLFTKLLLMKNFEQLIHKTRLLSLKDDYMNEERKGGGINTF